ncbi:flagellar protein FlgJ [Natranaerovirga pectinivora]|uniref:Flagellar protein FlgJ n=1 Tax=Natranaerovirga pectinivora TaxID=682400 RepID=A0A4R3MIJ1_9FIRM|nr:rod-binding protein [Natranaerovirga pectinivora]TCT14007.1 flagellar protein FlgJ [Natranaerovirga pectinivora]
MNINTYNINLNSTNNIDEKLKRKEDNNELKEMCREFESYFIEQMFKEMRKTVPKSGLIQESHGEQIFTDMLYQEYAKEASKGQGMGLAQMLYKQLSSTNKIIE